MESVKLNDILNYRFLSGLKYAPGGKTAAFTVSNSSEDQSKYESRIWIYDGKVRKLTDMGNENSFIWEDESHILFPSVRSEKDKKRKEEKDVFTSYYRIDINGGEASFAFTLPFSVSNIEKTECGYIAAGEIDVAFPDYYKMSSEERKETAKFYEEEKDYEVFDEIPFWRNGIGIKNKLRQALFTIDEKGNVQRVTSPEFNLGNFVVMGKEVFFTGKEYSSFMPLKNGAVYRLNLENNEITKFLDRPELNFHDIIKVNDKIWLSATTCDRHGINENPWVYILDTKTAELSLLRKEEYNMYSSVGSDCRRGGGYSWQSKDGKLYFIATREGNSVLNCLTDDGNVETVVGKDGSVDAISLSDDNDKALMIAMYENRLQELYSVDLKSGNIEKLSDFNTEALKDRYVADYNQVVVNSRGYDIEGWVLLPKDYDPSKTYPAVLDIHGGPKTVYGQVFFHEMQLWAGMGYFVFFCNPKGSDGRDSEFMDIRGDYGNTDYANIMDFTDAVLNKYPQIDKSKICVTGGSYGGFMTNWIIGHTDRFCCAASQRSISNWLSYYGVSDIGYFFTYDQCKADIFNKPENLWDQSPLKYAKNVKTPTLFIHSDEDYRCPLDQGLQMYSAIKAMNVPARLCMFHGENHELSRSGMPKHRIRRLTEITNWFEKYIRK